MDYKVYKRNRIYSHISEKMERETNRNPITVNGCIVVDVSVVGILILDNGRMRSEMKLF